MYKYLALLICFPILLWANPQEKPQCHSQGVIQICNDNMMLEEIGKEAISLMDDDDDLGPLAWNFMIQPGALPSEKEEPGKKKKMWMMKKYVGPGMDDRMEHMKDMEKEVLEFVKEYASPEQFAKICSTKTPVYGRLLMHLMKQKMEMEMLKTTDPERYELRKQIIKSELKSHELTEKVKSAKDDVAKSKVKEELMPVLNELFDLREKDREFEVKRLEKEITKLKNLLIERKKHKSEIVKDHMEELLEEDEYMKW